MTSWQWGVVWSEDFAAEEGSGICIVFLMLWWIQWPLNLCWTLWGLQGLTRKLKCVSLSLGLYRKQLWKCHFIPLTGLQSSSFAFIHILIELSSDIEIGSSHAAVVESEGTNVHGPYFQIRAFCGNRGLESSKILNCSKPEPLIYDNANTRCGWA